MRTIIVGLLVAATAAAQVAITSTETTSKEIVVRYQVPPRYEASSPCTVQASYKNEFGDSYTPLPDVDPVQFPQSDVDIARNPKPFVGRSRTVVIGKQIPFWETLPASATTGYRESLAVKAAETVYIKITCDRFSDTATASTKTVPFGLTFAESTPADPNAPGFTNWPSVKWGLKQTIIDPEYGTEIKRPDPAGVRGVSTATASFQEATGSSWSNTTGILGDDSSSASISGSQSVLALRWPYTSAPLGSVSQLPGDTSGLDWIQLTVKGTSSAGTADDGSIQTCLSIDGGAGSCYTPWHDIDIRSCGSGCSYPQSPTPVDHWQSAGGRPIPRQWLARRSGTFRYAASTSTVTITGGDHVGEQWTSGTKFRAFRGSPLHMVGMSSGSPLTVTFLENHGLSTGDSVAISNIDIYGYMPSAPAGSCAFVANGVWTVTVVNANSVTLDGSGGNCTYGLSRPVNSASAGSPPTITATNAFIPNSSYVKFSGFTDSGWASLNGQVFLTIGGGEVFQLAGASTSGTYSGGATMITLTGLAQPFSDFPIDQVIDGTHFTLASGPSSDVSTDTNWTVDPVHVLIRKKTNSPDTVSVQYAKVKTEVSAGTAWGAAGGEVCFPYDAPGQGGKMGSICMVGSSVLWIPRDGSSAQPFGLIPLESAGDLGNLGVACVSGTTDRGSMAINPNDPNRIYCAKYRYSSPDYFGVDEAVYVAEYEGDYVPRTETAQQLKAAYPSYGLAAMDAPWLPNCYGDGKLNDGNNPRIIPTRCVSYRKIIPSVHALIAASADNTWNKYVSNIDRLPCNGGSGARMNFVYRPSTNSVWASINCAPYGDQGGATYVFDLGNEKPVGDSNSTVRLVTPVDSWSQPGGRWGKYHGGAGLRDGYIVQFPHPMGLWSGVTFAIGYTDDPGRRCTLCGPYWTDYTAVDGSSGAYLTKSLQSCAPWAGSPYLPNPVPDGSGGKGCNTVTVAGEPGDDTPSSDEQAIMATNPSLHQSKTGSAGKYWLQDAIVGDIVMIDHDADRDVQHLEPAIIIAKSGNTWVLYRGGPKRVNNGSGGYAGILDHTGDTKRLIMQFSYDTDVAGWPTYYKPYDPVGPALTQKLIFGHGSLGDTLTAGTADGSSYGVVRGTLQQRLAATTFDFTVSSRGLAFEGKRANDSLSTDSHMTYVEAASLTNKDPWVVDCAPWNGYDGVAATGPVAGTKYVYKWTGPQLNASRYTNQFPKFLAPEVRIGMWVARNISGPNSVIDDTKPYTFCEVYLAGECRSGSAAGDVYVSVPLLDQPSSRYQCCGGDFTGLRDLSISSATDTFSRCTQTVLRSDSTGSTGRALLTVLHTPRAEDTFKNMSVTNTGLLGVMRERGVEFVKSELLTLTMPPIVFDGIDRTHFWKQTIPIRPYFGADNVIVRFGYWHYGDVTAGQYYCTTRQENCVVAAGTTSDSPFYFESADGYQGISCTSDCTATLPLIPNRVAYYEVVFRSGTSVLYTTPQQVVVSP